MNKIKILTVFLLAATSLSVAWAANAQAQVGTTEALAPQAGAGQNLQGDIPPAPPPPPPPEVNTVNSSSAFLQAAQNLENAQTKFNAALAEYLKEPTNTEKKDRAYQLADQLGKNIDTIGRMWNRMKKDVDKYINQDPTAAVQQMEQSVKSKKSLPPKTQEAMMQELQERLNKRKSF